jgi:hypothetical protein
MKLRDDKYRMSREAAYTTAVGRKYYRELSVDEMPGSQPATGGKLTPPGNSNRDFPYNTNRAAGAKSSVTPARPTRADAAAAHRDLPRALRGVPRGVGARHYGPIWTPGTPDLLGT